MTIYHGGPTPPMTEPHWRWREYLERQEQAIRETQPRCTCGNKPGIDPNCPVCWPKGK